MLENFISIKKTLVMLEGLQKQLLEEKFHAKMEYGVFLGFVITIHFLVCKRRG